MTLCLWLVLLFFLILCYCYAQRDYGMYVANSKQTGRGLGTCARGTRAASAGDGDGFRRAETSGLYGVVEGSSAALRLTPTYPEVKPFLQKACYDVPGYPLDPFLVNITEKDAALNHQISSGSDVQSIGNNVLRASVEGAEALPPTLTQLPELGPQRIQRTTWKQTPVTYLDYKCAYFDPNPRLFATDLDQLQYRRGLYMDTNYPEPPSRRQAYVQLLTAGFRNRRDVYTTATATNDLSHLSCKRLREEVPKLSNWPSQGFFARSPRGGT